MPVNELKKKIIKELDYQKSILEESLVTVLSSKIKNVILPDIKILFPDVLDIESLHRQALYELSQEGFIIIGNIENYSYMVKLVK